MPFGGGESIWSTPGSRKRGSESGSDGGNHRIERPLQLDVEVDGLAAFEHRFDALEQPLRGRSGSQLGGLPSHVGMVAVDVDPSE